MTEYSLERTDQEALKFTGELLSSGTTKSDNQEQGRWTDICIYKTIAGAYVVAIKENLRGEVIYNLAVDLDTPEQVYLFLTVLETGITKLIEKDNHLKELIQELLIKAAGKDTSFTGVIPDVEAAS